MAVANKFKSLDDRWDWVVTFMASQDLFVHELLLLLRKYPIDKFSTIGVRIVSGISELVYSPKFVESLSDPELRGVLTHEVYHLVLHHCTTRAPTDPTERKIFNIAFDLAINSIIISLGGQSERRLPESAVVPRQFSYPEKLTAEEYLQLLKKDWEKIKIKYVEDDTFTIDDHSGWSESAELDEEIRTKVAEMSRSSSIWGNLPGDVRDLILAAQESQIHWTKYLRYHVGNLISRVKQHTMKRPSRRFGYPYPGTKKRRIERTLVTIDTSASVGKVERSQFLAEINKLAEITPVDILMFDADVQYGPVRYARRHSSLEFVGNGGTDFRPPLKVASEAGYRSVIMLTDGQAAPVEYPDGVKNFLWVIIGDNNPPVEWGERVRIYPTGMKQKQQDVSSPSKHAT